MSDNRSAQSTGVVRDPHEIVPRLGASGLFKVKPPFNLTLSEEIEYTVTAVISIAGYQAEGKDAWTQVYQPVGASATLFEEDRLYNRAIMTLQSGLGEIYTIPASSVQMLPTADGIRYVASNFLVSLSALPEDEDLSILANDIKDLVEARLGVASAAEVIITSTPTLVSHDEHAAIVTAREAIIQERLTIREQLVHLQQQHARLMDQHNLLQTHVREKLLEDQTSP